MTVSAPNDGCLLLVLLYFYESFVEHVNEGHRQPTAYPMRCTEGGMEMRW